MRFGRWSILLSLLFVFGCSAKIVVVKVEKDKVVSADGVIYALPNTVVRVQMKIDKTEYTKARYPRILALIFAPDAKPVCEDENCTKENAKVYSMQQNATFSTYGEPDPGSVFLVKFAGKGAIDQALSMTWNEMGVATAASSTVTNRTGDVLLSTLKMAAGLGTKAALGAADTAKAEGLEVCPEPEAVTDQDSKPPTKETLDADKIVIPLLRKAGLGTDTTLVGNYCAMKPQERIEVAKNKGVLSRAVSDYVQVANLMKAKNDILSGGSLTQEPTNILGRIDTEIDRLLHLLYLGAKKVTTSDVVVDVRALEAEKPLPVLRINAAKGICIKAEVPPDAKPTSLKPLSNEDCGAASPVDLKLDFYPKKERQLFTRIQDVTEGERSFRYRIPAQVAAVLSEGKKSYGAGIFSVAQLGTTVSLPANRHSKMLNYDLGYIEATGGLKTFKLGTTGALDTATVDALNSIGGTLVDTRNTLRKNEDEATILTKEDQILKLRDEICTIQKKYGITCTVAPQQ